jgi:HK97 family phage prohead protease
MEPDLSKADFSGWATKASLKCSDGRSIMKDAFAHQMDGKLTKVPLVWQHGHKDVNNILGHAWLENREEGVYAHAFFNDTPQAKSAKEAVQHGDINMMSIWANSLGERVSQGIRNVYHGIIREVSLVISGANPGALIENVQLRHGDSLTELEDEAIIYTGLEFEVAHEDTSGGTDEDPLNGKTVQDVVDTMDDDQKFVLHYMVGEALEASAGSTKEGVLHSSDATIQEVYDTLTDDQLQVVDYLVTEALQHSSTDTDKGVQHAADTDKGVQHASTETDADAGDKKGNLMHKNVFEGKDSEGNTTQLAFTKELKHGIIDDAMNDSGTLQKALENFGLQHGIEDIETLFPEATDTDVIPQWLKRETSWVAKFMGATRKLPFSKVRTRTADLTEDEARAKGYVKGAFKKDEFFKVSSRTTSPTTVYKKQSLDRDDIVDITDFDVVMWLKAEMRVMLDEEIARAALIGDGRLAEDEDKIDEDGIRPISKEHELFATHLYVNLEAPDASIQEFIDALIENRKYYKGSGLPNMYTTETLISKFLLLKDTIGRRIYANLQEVADELRVAEIIPVEVMEDDEENTLAIIVNPLDYSFGATKGGEVSSFEDFDIDYNKHKYLIETRLSGALTKIKSAIVVHGVDADSVLAEPAAPTFDKETNEVTIVNTTGVVYKNAAGTTINAAGSPYSVPTGGRYVVNAFPAPGYYFATSNDDSWSFKYQD